MMVVRGRAAAAVKRVELQGRAVAVWRMNGGDAAGKAACRRRLARYPGAGHWACEGATPTGQRGLDSLKGATRGRQINLEAKTTSRTWVDNDSV